MVDVIELESDLRSMGTVRAPVSLMPGVLAGAGLADRYARAASPVGDVFIAYSSVGVSAVLVAEDAESFERSFLDRFGRRVFASNGFPLPLARAIERRLGGQRVAPPFDLRGTTPFQRSVLEKTLEIPHGEVRPYAWIAREIGTPKAMRAVGSALGANPVPLLIPCHRVVRGDGTLGQYSMGGPEVKQRLLSVEGATPWLSGTPIVGSDTTKIFCYPTCRHARRVTQAHSVSFSGVRDAERRGYRACKICRPA